MAAWTKVGEIGVDAGLCWIGDPCYILHANPKPTAIGKDWSGFCDKLGGNKSDGVTTFAYDMGHAGLGVAVSTGYGDGCYPVEVRRNAEGRIAEVRVVFISDDEDGDAE